MTKPGLRTLLDHAEGWIKRSGDIANYIVLEGINLMLYL
jgi:hypothetical protein